MGGISSKFLKAEKNTWLEHNLKFEEKVRIESLQLLDKFEDDKPIYLSHVEREYEGYTFQHWFVTNRDYFLEFGSERDDIYTTRVKINNKPKRPYSVNNNKNMDEAIRTRMRHVIGMKTYSLCLRNSEHIANYVFSGKWISNQMGQNGYLLSIFESYLKENNNRIRLVNSSPESIRPHLFSTNTSKVYDFIERELVATKFEYFLDYDDDTYNILVVGPTGAGKSRFINVLFNQQICDSEQSFNSVTRDICNLNYLNF